MLVAIFAVDDSNVVWFLYCQMTCHLLAADEGNPVQGFHSFFFPRDLYISSGGLWISSMKSMTLPVYLYMVENESTVRPPSSKSYL